MNELMELMGKLIECRCSDTYQQKLMLQMHSFFEISPIYPEKYTASWSYLTHRLDPIAEKVRMGRKLLQKYC